MLGQKMILTELLENARHEFCVQLYCFETHGFAYN